MIRLTVEGRAFYVRPEHVIAIGTGYQEVPPAADDPSGESTRVLTTMVTVAHVGTLPVEQESSEVRDMLGVQVIE